MAEVHFAKETRFQFGSSFPISGPGVRPAQQRPARSVGRGIGVPLRPRKDNPAHRVNRRRRRGRRASISKRPGVLDRRSQRPSTSARRCEDAGGRRALAARTPKLGRNTSGDVRGGGSPHERMDAWITVPKPDDSIPHHRELHEQRFPPPAPHRGGEYYRTMYDCVLTLSTELTRVVSYMRGGSEGKTAWPYRKSASHKPRHELSHHNGDPAQIGPPQARATVSSTQQFVTSSIKCNHQGTAKNSLLDPARWSLFRWVSGH